MLPQAQKSPALLAGPKKRLELYLYRARWARHSETPGDEAAG